MNVMCEKTDTLSQSVLNLAQAVPLVKDDHTREVLYLTIERPCDTISASLQTQRRPDKPEIKPHWSDIGE